MTENKHKKSRNYALYLSSAALCISLVGLFISGASYAISKKEYTQERWLILKGSSDEKFNELIIQPVDEDAYFMYGNVIFPSKVLTEPAQIESDGKMWAMGTLRYRIGELIREKYSADKDTSNIIDLSVPIVIQSYYASNGQSYTDKSLYTLNLRIVLTIENIYAPDITFRGLYFVDRLDPDYGGDVENLNSIYESEGFYLPIRTP